MAVEQDVPEADKDVTDMIARSVRAAYGERCVEYAQRQIDAADGENKAKWEAIAAILIR